MDDKPSKLSDAISIARRTLSIVRQNIFFALAVKALVLVLSAASPSPNEMPLTAIRTQRPWIFGGRFRHKRFAQARGSRAFCGPAALPPVSRLDIIVTDSPRAVNGTGRNELT